MDLMIMKPKGREGGRGREEGGRAEGGRRTGGGFGGTGRKRELRRLSDALGDLGAAEALSNEDISLIWFDADMVEGNEEKAKLKETVQDEVSNAVFFYTNKTACMAYIESQTKAKIFFILSSDSYEVDEFPAIHAIVQIDCILILSTNTEKYETLLNNTTFPKIVDIFAELTPLLESIKKQVSLLAKQSAAFSLYDQNQKATRNLSQETGSFLYLQLFKDVLMKMPHTEESKLEMLDKCRGYCRGNKKEMGNINDFYLTYKSNEDSLTIVHKVLKIKHKANDSIPWYTKETFLYRLVNKAMRTEDIEALYTFRFFIVDLSNMLQRRYRLFKRKLGKKEAAKHTVYLYRGFQQSPEEIQKLRENVGNLISTNGFLSTSRARSVALGFARNINRPNVEPVLFEIKTCTALRTAVFTDIKEFSAFPEEEEVLFDLGACFSIDSFEYDEEEKLWTQKMSATDRGLEIVEEYMEFRRKEMAEFDVVIMFGNLLLDMGEYLKAQKYFENLIRVRPDHEHAPSIYGNIAIAHYYKGEYDDAMTNYKKAYDIFINTKPIRYPDAARALNGIGIINRLKQNYDAALESYEQALLLYQKKYKPVHIEVANTLNSIGIIHNKKNEFDQAIDFYNRAYEMYKLTLPADHPDTSSCLNNIGVAYRQLNDYEQAMDFATQSLRMREKTLPSGHPDIGRSCENIGLVHCMRHEYVEGLENCMKAADIFEKKFGPDSIDVLRIKHNINKIKELMGDVTEDTTLMAGDNLLSEKKLALFNGEESTKTALELNNKENDAKKLDMVFEEDELFGDNKSVINMRF